MTNQTPLKNLRKKTIVGKIFALAIFGFNISLVFILNNEKVLHRDIKQDFNQVKGQKENHSYIFL